MSVLKFSKTVLDKVSFDEDLFEKELRKAMGRLVREEVEELQAWCYRKFPELAGVLDRHFSKSRMAAS